MLAQPTDYGYSPSSGYQQTQMLQHHQSDERPKLYGLEPAQGVMPGMPTMMDYQQQLQMQQRGTPHHAMAVTPQQAMTPSGQYEHEPLVMGVAPAGHYYAPMGTHMLLVSSDFDYANANGGNSSVSSAGSKGGNKPGTKRSREDLNLKEKKRMFKLNDRITQLKQMLEDAGVQTKKNKQSILDNAAYFIEQLQSDLMIAKQKAERAEREAEQMKAQASSAATTPTASTEHTMLSECFLHSTTPRVLVDLALTPVQVNTAFVAQSGRSEQDLRSKDSIAPFLCADAAKLESMVRQVCAEARPANAVVQAETIDGPTSVLLVATAVRDAAQQAKHVELSVLPCGDRDDAKSETTDATESAASESE